MFQDSAACHGMWEIFDNPRRKAEAKAICATCPVINDCLRFAIENDFDFGIYGGFTPDQRKNLIASGGKV